MQKLVNLVDLVKSFQTSIYLMKLIVLFGWKIGVDRVENGPLKVCQKFKISQKLEKLE